MTDRVFETGSRRDSDEGKPPLNKLPWAALKEVAFVHQYGDDHYGVGNWRKGQYFSVLADSALRHVTSFLLCEDIDKKSKKYHLAHAAWNCLVLLYEMIFYSKYKHLDDRVEVTGEWHSTAFAVTDRAKALERGVND
jgi:hypothetical protein